MKPTLGTHTKSDKTHHGPSSREGFYDNDGGDDGGDEDGDGTTHTADVAGMDLETFMGNYQVNIGVGGMGGAGSKGGSNKDDPSMRPLDGVSPNKNNSDRDRELVKKFGDAGLLPVPLAQPPVPIRASSGSGRRMPMPMPVPIPMPQQQQPSKQQRLTSPVVATNSATNEGSGVGSRSRVIEHNAGFRSSSNTGTGSSSRKFSVPAAAAAAEDDEDDAEEEEEEEEDDKQYGHVYNDQAQEQEPEQGQGGEYHDEASALLARIRGGASSTQFLRAEGSSNGSGNGGKSSLTDKQLAAYQKMAGAKTGLGGTAKLATTSTDANMNTMAKSSASASVSVAFAANSYKNASVSAAASQGRGDSADNAARVDELLAMVEQRTKSGIHTLGLATLNLGTTGTSSNMGDSGEKRKAKKGGMSGGLSENSAMTHSSTITGASGLSGSSTRETLNKLKERHQQMEFALSGPSVKQPARTYGLEAPGYFGNAEKAKGGTSPRQKQKGGGNAGTSASFSQLGTTGEGATDLAQSYLVQIASLKKELKHRDDRLQRVTEHSLSLGQTSDRQKTEIDVLQEKLRASQLESEAKDTRVAECSRRCKKAQKRAKLFEETATAAQGAVQEIQRLKDREVALIEAVEALSAQNEDLIAKLKQSMARELELSSNAPAGGSVHGAGRHVSTSPPRAQSDTRDTRRKGRGGDPPFQAHAPHGHGGKINGRGARNNSGNGNGNLPGGTLPSLR